jgi:uncharacterized membrane protein
MKSASISHVKHTLISAVSKSAVIAVLLSLPVFLGAQTLSAQTPQSTFKKLNPPGSTYTFAWGLNNKGNFVVGSFVDASGVYRAYSYIGGKFRTIVFPGATFTQANGVNDSNTVVGTFIGSDQLTHSFLLENGNKFSLFSLSKSASTYVYGINNAGTLVGFVGNEGKNKGFISIGGKVTLFTVIGNTTYAYAINASNTVVGSYIDPKLVDHGFIRTADGSFQRLDPPGSTDTHCLTINDSGEIAGVYIDNQMTQHAFTYENGKFHTSSLPAIDGINNEGMYVGWYLGHDGATYGYLAKP